ncbi:hypothetical protein EB796_009907 [Bugula neritina]|uniref:Uncharacterized protein n=1 Tax=Bugula neritina TaxID=10212 RepID=A0A7J7K0T4_BUGNE|nr:hypothetical protein EB796_009907 [Bugula neritina]
MTFQASNSYLQESLCQDAVSRLSCSHHNPLASRRLDKLWSVFLSFNVPESFQNLFDRRFSDTGCLL